MPGDGNHPLTDPGDRGASSDVLRPITRSGWTGLLGETGTTTGRPRYHGVRWSFARVLGPWQPSVEALSPRLSFLALPWLVREVHSTERITTERVETVTTLPEEPTPETTTVYRLLRDADGSPYRARPRPDDSETPPESRSGAPTSETTTSNAATLHEVLAWRPVLVDPTLSGQAGDSPAPTRSVDRGERPGDGRVGRAGNTEVATGPSGTHPADRYPWTGPGAGTPSRPDVGGSSASVGGFHPWTPGTGALEPPRVDASVAASGSPVRATLDSPVGSYRSGMGITADGTTAPGGSGRPATTLPGEPDGSTDVDGRSGSTGTASRSAASPASASDDGTGPVTLTYRDAGIRDSGIRQATGTSERGDPPVSPTAATADSAARSASPGEAGPAVETPGEIATLPATDPRGTPSVPASPFASFADADAAVEHVYHEIERRWRIERERRGL